MENSSEIMKNLNKPIFHKCISSKTNKIFIKYTQLNYRQYSLSIIKSLCYKSPYYNKNSLFYQTLLFHDIVLYNCGNEVYINNLDLLILCCFLIAIKSLCDQYHILKIKDLKNIYREKFCLYKNEDIISNEIICLKLLDYNINYMSSYDFLCYFIHNNNNDKILFEYSNHLLENLYNGDIKYYVFKSQYNIALEIFSQTKEQFKIKSIILSIPSSKNSTLNPSKVNNEDNDNNKSHNDSNSYNKIIRLAANSPLKRYIRKDIHIEFSKSKIINNSSNLSGGGSTNNIFSPLSQNNASMNSKNNSPNKKTYLNTINNLKLEYKKDLIGSCNNILECKRKTENENNKNKKESLAIRLGSPVNFVNMKKNSMNIDFKYLSTINKKINYDKFIIYNPRNRNCVYKKKLNFDNNNNKVEVND
jgi:hypothetical protein